MSTQSTKAADIYQQKLKDEGEKLKNCQAERQIKSCFECEMLFGCEIRTLYVKSVYESMSHGQSGGFEF